jgi:hypothetical protein
MTTFTVHEPPPRRKEAVAPSERFAFVRDGFYFWAFILGPVWMLYHRMWLVFVFYMVALTGIEIAMWALGVSFAVKLVVGLLIALLVGFEAGTLRRWSLRRWTERGIIVAYNREAAEHRFFDRWQGREGGSYEATMPPTSPEPPPIPPHVPTSDADIIGLFPQPQTRS